MIYSNKKRECANTPLTHNLIIMTDTNNYKPLQVLTLKDISNIICCHVNTAKHYAKDIKDHFGIERITYTHLKNYLKL